MRFLNFPAKTTVISLVLIFTICGCHEKKRIIKSPPHYNFGEVFADKLDIKIKEISGLVWDTKINEFLVHQDESGKLFVLDKETKIIKGEYTFAGKGDYEDIAMLNNIAYVLRSDGMITKIIKDSAGGMRGVEAGKISISGTNDFEAMYGDTSRNALIILCKNCKMDNKEVVSAFAFYPDSLGFDNNPVFSIDLKEVEKLAPQKSSRLEPSAAAIHPVLKKIFIVSSGSNQLVITDLNGKAEAVFELGKKLFPQAEGITFKSNGDMYISNEGVNERATILRFVYRP